MTVRSEDLGREHVDRYRETDGELGHDWKRGAPVLLLTTTGRRSGEPRTMPLIYQPWHGAHLIVASKGGSQEPPAWFQPEADPGRGPDQGRSLPGAVSHAEEPDMWRAMAAIWPYYDIPDRTDRQIPVVVLERI